MKVVLLAGGFGSRISEESQFKPKPMIEIGGMPILWHIMKEYAYYGHTEFIICAGYKQEYIKEWFANYFLHNSDVTFDYRNGKNEMTVHQTNMEPWKVTVVDTGYNTMTGGRIKRIQQYVGNEPFLMTYGDGVCDVEIDKLIEFHKSMVSSLHLLPSRWLRTRVYWISPRIRPFEHSVRSLLLMALLSMRAIWCSSLRYSTCSLVAIHVSSRKLLLYSSQNKAN